jgi:hypothetical protein
MDAPRQSEWLLIHGTVESPLFGQIGHAWLRSQSQSRVYDPDHDQIWDSDEYARVLGAVEVVSYTMTEAAQLMLAHNHLGPWIDLPGA